MSDSLALLENLPGVAGYYYLKKNGVPFYKEHATLTKDCLKKLSLSLSMLCSYGEKAEFKAQAVKFKFDRFVVLGMKLKDDAFLLVLCQPQANSSLISSVLKRSFLMDS